MGKLSNKLTVLKEQYFPSNASYSSKDQLGYCGGLFGNSMGQDIASEFADIFARDYMGIKAKKITLFDNIALFFGFLSGTLSGYILDTPEKPGKKTMAKRISAIAPLPFTIASVMMFVVPSSSTSVNYIWKCIFHLIFNISDVFYDASMNAMSLRITTDPKDRKNFYTVGTLSAVLGSMLPAWLIPILVDRAGSHEAEQTYYFFTTLAFSVIGLITMFVPYFLMQEKVHLTKRPEQEKLVWDKQTVMALLHNRTFIVTELGTLFEMVRKLSYRLLTYLYRDVLLDFDLSAPMGALSGSLGYVGLLSVPILTKRFSPRTIISGGFAYTGFFFTLIGLFGRNQSVQALRKRKLLFGLLIALSGMPNHAISASKKILVGNATDYMEWYAEKEYGKPIRAEGFISAVQSALGNVFNVICTNLYDFGFHRLDYDTTVIRAPKGLPERTDKTIFGLFRMMVLFGVIGNCLAALTYLFENYNGKRKEAVETELAEMRARRQLVDAAAQTVAQA